MKRSRGQGGDAHLGGLRGLQCPEEPERTGWRRKRKKRKTYGKDLFSSRRSYRKRSTTGEGGTEVAERNADGLGVCSPNRHRKGRHWKAFESAKHKIKGKKKHEKEENKIRRTRRKEDEVLPRSLVTDLVKNLSKNFKGGL